MDLEAGIHRWKLSSLGLSSPDTLAKGPILHYGIFFCCKKVFFSVKIPGYLLLTNAQGTRQMGETPSRFPAYKHFHPVNFHKTHVRPPSLTSYSIVE
jgi:hypothetical protein